MSHRISRRTALHVMGGALGAAGLGLAGCATGRSSGARRAARGASGWGNRRHPPLRTAEGRDFSPMDRTLGEIAPKEFFGENPTQTHELLWNARARLASAGGPPPPTERVPVVVVGAGISGVSAAYLLRKHRPVILERGARFGGNSLGQSWRGVDYAIGAAYFTTEENDHVWRLFDEIGILKECRPRTAEDPVLYRGGLLHDFWSGASAPEARAQFTLVRDRFIDLLKERNGQRYPVVPTHDPDERAHTNQVDRKSLLGYVEDVVREAGHGKLHPHIRTVLEHYCWSTYAAPAGQVSAATGINAYAYEWGNIMVAPGGNGVIVERLLERMRPEVPAECFRPESLVLDVRAVADGAVVTYADRMGALHALHAKAVILACPKLVVASILRDIEPERLSAIKQLEYTSYVVGNVLIEGSSRNDIYDLFVLGSGEDDLSSIEAAADEAGITDVVFASFAQPDAAHTVLSLYRGLPYKGGRNELLAPSAYERFRSDFEAQITEQLLPVLGIEPSRVRELRLARFGHPMPVSAPGLIADGVVDRLFAPFRERVFFVEQDNWMNPAIETCIAEAMTWTKRAERVL